MSTDLENILKTDIKLASGSIPKGSVNFTDLTEEICFYMSDFETNKAHLLTELHQTSKLLSMRAKVQAGEFIEALKYIKECEKESDSEMRAEALLSKAGVLGHQGQWQECLMVGEEGLKLNPIMITKLSLLQCQTMALFELGFNESALKNCDLILSQKKLYPEAVAVRYSYFLKLRALINSSSGIGVKKDLDKIWMEFSGQKKLDLDRLLCLIRLEIEYKRKIGEPISALALFSFKLAQLLADPLYEGLAVLDLFCCDPGNLKIEKLLKYYRNKFNKIENLYRAYIYQSPDSETSRSLLNTCKEKMSDEVEMSFDYFLNPETKLLFNLGNLSCKELPPQVNWTKFKDIFHFSNVSRAMFFENLWEQKYFYQKHDGVIRTFIHRLKKKTDLPLESENGNIVLRDTIIL